MKFSQNFKMRRKPHLSLLTPVRDMEYVEAQQASYIAYRLCRGMGHLYAHLPLGSR